MVSLIVYIQPSMKCRETLLSQMRLLHEVVIETVGNLEDLMQSLAKQNSTKRLFLLGFDEDIDQLLTEESIELLKPEKVLVLLTHKRRSHIQKTLLLKPALLLFVKNNMHTVTSIVEKMLLSSDDT